MAAVAQPASRSDCRGRAGPTKEIGPRRAARRVGMGTGNPFPPGPSAVAPPSPLPYITLGEQGGKASEAGPAALSTGIDNRRGFRWSPTQAH